MLAKISSGRMSTVCLIGLLLTIPVIIPPEAFARSLNACPKGMQSFWDLDETGGSTYLDLVGLNHAVCVGTCPEADPSGKIQGGQRFNRLFSTGMNVSGHPFDWRPGSTFTLEFWMRKESSCSGSLLAANEVILGRDSDDPGNGLHWWVGVDCGRSPPSGVLNFTLIDKSGAGTSLVSSRNVTDGRWHHVVAVRDGIRRQNLLYVDGVLEAAQTFMYPAGFDAADTPVNIGWLNLGQGYRYTGILDELAIYTGALPEETIRSHYFLARGYCSACDRPVRIMPLGDSITAGMSSGADNPSNPMDSSHWTSYRRRLWLDMAKGGYCADFVGSQQGGSFFGDFDPDHEGHGGWRDDQIANSISGWLTASKPDVILLHIGTNGLHPSPADVERILNRIDEYDQDVTVLLARIINRACAGGPCGEVALTTQFNDNVQAMAQARIQRGDKIIMVDQESGAGIHYDFYPAGDMWDAVHPFESGYRKMARTWLKSLESFLPECRPAPPTITSRPNANALIGRPYRYAVNCRGIPAPVFYLESHPDGMSIDPNSGLVTWTPSFGGRYAVTVVAENSLGKRMQRFNILASPCTFIQEQPSSVSVAQGASATFRIRAAWPRNIRVSYQWLRNGVVIPGANSSSYRLSRVTAADNGSSFRCIVSGGDCPAVQSQAAVLTVR